MDPRPETSGPQRLPSDGVLGVAALLYFAFALVPVLGLVERGWQRHPYGRPMPIPWAEVVVLVVGTLAAAAAARPAASFQPLAKASARAGVVLASGAALTALAVAGLVGVGEVGRYVRYGRGSGVGIASVPPALAPYVAFQLALGLATAVVVRLATWSRRRHRVAADGFGMSEWERLAILAAGYFLAVDGPPFLLLTGLSVAKGDFLDFFHSPSNRTAAVFWSIFPVLGTVTAAWISRAVVRWPAPAAYTVAFTAHLLSAVLVAPLAYPGFVAEKVAARASLDEAMITAQGALFGAYGAGLFILVPATFVQGLVGTAAAVLLRRDARARA